MALYLDSEKVGPTGAVTSRGVLNQLGRPQLDPLAVLVREAVQNSWDARSSSKTPIDIGRAITFGVNGWSLTERQKEILRRGIFGQLPPGENLPLRDVLNRTDDIHALMIYDRGTTGLGGPTRADKPTRPEETRDFVDFLRNVGQPSDKKLAGGTYGYGKAAFYRVSHSNTILVHTRCEYKGKVESRFIASALGYPFTPAGGVPHTGRHWWGRRDVDIAEPLLDDEADKVAELLGMPTYDGELGTTIMILQPFLKEIDPSDNSIIRTPWQAMNVIAENILLYFWPKMLKYDRQSPAIQFEIMWDNQHIPLPQPEDYLPLTGYVNAMYRLKGYDVDSIFPHRTETVESLRPRQFLGNLALEKYPMEKDTAFDTGKQSEFSKLTHHTALMRQPELVVKYLSGPVSSNARLGYGGVFITDQEVDAIFAESEPPTHDDWVPESLADNWHQRYVRISQTRISNFMEEFAKPSDVKTGARELTPLGAFSNTLGTSLLSAIPGNSAATPFSSNYKPPRQEKLSAKPARQNTGDDSMSNKKNESTQNVFGRIADRFGINNQNKEESSTASELPVAPQYIPPTAGPLSGISSDISNIPLFGANKRNEAKIGTEQSDESSSTPPKKFVGRSRVQTYPETAFVSVGEIPALQVQFSVTHGKNAVGTQITAEVSAIIDGSAIETDPPLGASRAEVIRWIDPENGMYEGSPSVFVTAESIGVWKAFISLPEDLMIDVSFKADAIGGES